jgi:hypothetical protein
MRAAKLPPATVLWQALRRANGMLADIAELNRLCEVVGVPGLSPTYLEHLINDLHRKQKEAQPK